MSSLDGLREAIGEGAVVVLREIDGPAIDLREVVGAQQVRNTSRVNVPDAVLPPYTLLVVAPGALPLRVQCARAIPFDAGDTKFPARDFLRKTRAQQHRLVGSWAGSQRKQPPHRVEIAPPDVAAERFVHGVVPDHVGQIFQTQRDLLKSSDVMSLQIGLRRLARYAQVGREIVAAKKEGEHGGGSQFAAIGGPEHLWKGVAIRGMDDSSARCAKMGHVKAHRFQSPSGRAIAARKATPHVLVRVNEEGDAVFSSFLSNLVDILKILLVIDARPGVFDSFPGDKQAQKGEAPRAQAREMLIRFAQGKRSPHKGDAPVVEEAFANKGRAIRRKGDLAASSQVDAAQHEGSAMFVFEVWAVNVNHY